MRSKKRQEMMFLSSVHIPGTRIWSPQNAFKVCRIAHLELDRRAFNIVNGNAWVGTISLPIWRTGLGQGVEGGGEVKLQAMMGCDEDLLSHPAGAYAHAATMACGTYTYKPPRPHDFVVDGPI